MTDSLFQYYEKDFTKIITKLAKSPDIELESAADRVGTILLTIDMLARHNPQKWRGNNKAAYTKSGNDYCDMTADELQSAECCWKEYQQTGDDLFKQLAKQKLVHANVLCDKACACAKTANDKTSAQELKAKCAEIEIIMQ